MEQIILSIAQTSAAATAFLENQEHIIEAAKRYPVVIGPSGAVFYDAREYSSHVQNELM